VYLEPTKLQQPPRQRDLIDHGPRDVEVPAVRDEHVSLAWVFSVTMSIDFCAGILCYSAPERVTDTAKRIKNVVDFVAFCSSTACAYDPDGNQ
jgi:hypothetical protein